MRRISTLFLALLLLAGLAIPAHAHGSGHGRPDVPRPAVGGDDEPFEVEVDPSLVTVGEAVELEIEFEAPEEEQEEDGDSDDEVDVPDHDGEPDDDPDGDDEEQDADEQDGEQDGESDVTMSLEDEDDNVGGDDVVAFSVDWGDGSSVEVLDADGDETEAKAEATHTYATAGSYGVTVTATVPDGGSVAASDEVTVTTEPVPHPRRGDRPCPGDDVAEEDDNTGDTGNDGDLDEDAANDEPLAAARGPRFDDVPAASVHRRAIDCLANWGALVGATARSFRPQAKITREQLATVLARLLAETGVEPPSETVDHFTDDDGSVHESNINVLAELGLVSGSGGGHYAPNAAVSRAQLVAIVVRFVEYVSGADLEASLDYFTDDGDSTHEDAVNRAAAAGLVSGAKHLLFDPDASISREQVASILVRVLDLLIADGAVDDAA